MAERVVWVEYQWKDEEVAGDTDAMVVILNDPKLYKQLSEDDEFDQRVWFYFQDEAEFQRAFDPKNDEHDFYLVSIVDE
jgi:hypothetical protein